MVSEFGLLVKVDFFFFFLILLTILVNIYSIIYSQVKTIVNKITLYSIYFTTFSQVRIVVGKTSLFYFTNQYYLD